MVEVSVKGDVRQVLRSLKGLEKKVIEKATVSALNRTVKQGFRLTLRHMAKNVGLTQKVLAKEFFRMFKATRSRMDAVILARPHVPNLIRFAAKQRKTGVSAKIYGRTKTHAGAFIANQERTVFKRTSAKRLPIKPLFGPSFAKELLNFEKTGALDTLVRKKFPVHFARDLRFFINRQNARLRRP